MVSLNHALFHQNFTSQAVETPGAIALQTPTSQLTYEQLEMRSSQLAHLLRTSGAAAESRVGVMLDRSPALIATILGVMKAGSAYVPLDPHEPTSRLKAIMNDAGLTSLVTQRDFKAYLPAHPASVLFLDDLDHDLEGVPSASSIEAGGLDDLAYMIYTSGSTGAPKGVLVPHRGIVNLAASQIPVFDLTPTSRVLQFAAPTFDASVSEIVTTLLAGATLVVVPSTDPRNGDVRRLLRDFEITTVTLPPSLLAVLEPADFPALRVVVSAGEACTPDLAARWGTGRRLVNAYGPTEATVCATMAIQDPDAAEVSIGSPVLDTRVYLVDPQGRVLEGEGQEGELWVSGPGVGLGYNNLPELTSEKFLADPFDPSNRYRVYRTGDVARRLPGGALSFIGRVDGQIKLRGFRIEPGEVESLLGHYPGVRQAHVVKRADPHGNDRLVAYLVTDGRDVSSEAVRRFCNALLSNYMIPSAFHCLERFPLTTSGKIDDRALPEPDFSAIRADIPYAAPSTAMEGLVSDIWEAVVGVTPIGIDDNFFDVGGHSLMATRVVSLLRQRLGLDVPLSVVLTVEPTVRQTARILEEYQLSHADPRELEVLLAEIDGLSDEDVRLLLDAEGAT